MIVHPYLHLVQGLPAHINGLETILTSRFAQMKNVIMCTVVRDLVVNYQSKYALQNTLLVGDTKIIYVHLKVKFMFYIPDEPFDDDVILLIAVNSRHEELASEKNG